MGSEMCIRDRQKKDNKKRQKKHRLPFSLNQQINPKRELVKGGFATSEACYALDEFSFIGIWVIKGKKVI